MIGLDIRHDGPAVTNDSGRSHSVAFTPMQVCAACHSVQQLHFRNLVDVAYTEEEAKTMAADIEVTLIWLAVVSSHSKLRSTCFCFWSRQCVAL